MPEGRYHFAVLCFKGLDGKEFSLAKGYGAPSIVGVVDKYREDLGERKVEERREGRSLRVVCLFGRSVSGRFVYNTLVERCEVQAVFREAPPSRRRLLKRRISRLGVFKVAGQVMFQVVERFIRRMSTGRIEDIIADSSLSLSAIPASLVTDVESVNDEAVVSALQELQPDIVMVNGTRIVSRAVLAAIDAPFVNVHVGITPMYRGVHGGYWALAEGDPGNFGATIHLLDEGIDTGSVLKQVRTVPTSRDNFSTYPAVQWAATLPHLVDVLEGVASGALRPTAAEGTSALRYHPTLWGYLRCRMRGVK